MKTNKNMHINEIDELIEANVFLLDVRESFEYASGHLKNSKHISVNQMEERLSDIPKDETVYVYCHSGGRSQIAANILNARGYDAVNLDGGFSAYTGAHRDV
ncbi:MAG TPA: rhodanese-like domain-containing protein [Bacillota bacterium]|nr:rhodanese-like domain-containing protein [Bacillota bacterium]